MEDHLEPVEVEPSARLSALQVVVEIPGGEAEGVKILLRSEQQHGGSFLVVDPCRYTPVNDIDILILILKPTRVIPLPLPHEVDVVWLRGEAVSVPTERCS